MKNNNIVQTIRLLVPAQNAKLAPPLGPILGQFGINIMNFCKQFNNQTTHLTKDLMLPVVFFLYKDKSFTFTYKKPTISFLIKKIYHNLSTSYVISNFISRNTSIRALDLYSISAILYTVHNFFCVKYIKYTILCDTLLNNKLNLIFINYNFDYNLSNEFNNKNNKIKIEKKIVLPNKAKIIYLEQIYKLCIFKYGQNLKDLEYFNLCKSILGSLKSMDIKVK